MHRRGAAVTRQRCVLDTQLTVLTRMSSRSGISDWLQGKTDGRKQETLFPTPRTSATPPTFAEFLFLLSPTTTSDWTCRAVGGAPASRNPSRKKETGIREPVESAGFSQTKLYGDRVASAPAPAARIVQVGPEVERRRCPTRVQERHGTSALSFM